MKSGDKILL